MQCALAAPMMYLATIARPAECIILAGTGRTVTGAASADRAIELCRESVAWRSRSEDVVYTGLLLLAS